MVREIKARNRGRSGPHGKVSQRRVRVPGACEATGDSFRSLLGESYALPALPAQPRPICTARGDRFGYLSPGLREVLRSLRY